MNFWNIIGTLRKFGNFLIGLFPALGVIVDDLINYLKKQSERPAIAPHWQRFSGTRFWKGAARFFERFYWRDYSKDRLDFDSLPSETIPVLRPVFLVALALCLTMPLAEVTHWTSVPIETLSGMKGEAPIWSTVLWICASALGWGSLLVGTSLSNRIICGAIIIGFIVIFGNCSFFGPVSIWNALLPVAAIVAYYFCERVRSQPPHVMETGSTNTQQSSTKNTVLGSILAIAIGCPIGIYLAALTPLHDFVKPNVLVSGAAFGVILTFVVLATVRLTSSAQADERSEQRTAQSFSNVANMVWVVTALTGGFLLTLAFRGGLGQSSSYLLSALMLWNSTLWPIWYFIGIGIIFKLIKNGQVFARSIRDIVPTPIFLPFVVVLIIATSLLTWSETAITVLPTIKDVPFTMHLFQLFSLIYSQSLPWLWKDVMLASAAEWMKWFLLFAIIALGWLRFKRQLNNETAASVFYLTILAWFLIYEYMFQWLSLGRSPTHSIILVTLFSIWLLWLYQRIGLPMSLQSSPMWPTRGRLPIYGGIMLFCLLEIHARSVIDDYTVMNQLFLVMFRGIIDVGFPYFLYVFATRKFRELPVKLITIFCIFCFGALLALPINVIDKLALNNWSLSRFGDYCASEVASLASKNIPELGIATLPISWILSKSLIFTTALAIVAFIVFHRSVTSKGSRTLESPSESSLEEPSERTSNRPVNLPASVAFSLLSFASGFASFSKTSIDLPLPTNWSLLLAPIHSALQLDAYVFVIYLAAWLPALILALFLTWSKTTSPSAPSILNWISGFSIAVATHFGITYAFAFHEPWLRSTGMLYTCGLGFIGLFLFLAMKSIYRIDAATVDEANVAGSTSQQDSLPPDTILLIEPSLTNTPDAIPSVEPSLLIPDATPSAEPSLASAPNITPSVEPSFRNAPTPPKQLSPVVSQSEANAIAVLCLALLVSRAIGQVASGAFVEQNIPSMERSMMIPSKWGASRHGSDKSTTFACSDQNGVSSLILNRTPSEAAGVLQTMQRLVNEAKASKAISNLTITFSEKWNHFYPGALALYYTFDLNVSGPPLPKLGLTVLCPLPNNKSDVYSIITTPAGISEQKWDLVRIIARSKKQ